VGGLPRLVHPDLAAAYAAKGIRRPYTHQAEAAEAVHAGKKCRHRDMPTASGRLSATPAGIDATLENIFSQHFPRRGRLRLLQPDACTGGECPWQHRRQQGRDAPNGEVRPLGLARWKMAQGSQEFAVVVAFGKGVEDFVDAGSDVGMLDLRTASDSVIKVAPKRAAGSSVSQFAFYSLKVACGVLERNMENVGSHKRTRFRQASRGKYHSAALRQAIR